MLSLECPGTPVSCRKITTTSTLLKRSISKSNHNDDNLTSLNSPCHPVSCLKSPASNKRFKPVSSPYLDRFIPNRQNIDYENCNMELVKAIQNDENRPKETKTNINKTAPLDILTPNRSKRMVDVFNSSHHVKKPLHEVKISQSELMLPSSSSSAKKKFVNRVLPSKPSRILDAPDLIDDYYLNLLDWGSNNIIAIALRKSVYLWHADVGKIDHLFELEGDDDFVTSVKWASADHNMIAVGTNSNTVQIWDASTLTQVREMDGHSARVSSLSWNKAMPHMISSGSRDSLILHHDTRVSRRLPFVYVGHEQEVCGLQWSPDGKTLASGGNENVICLWDAAMSAANSTRTPLSPTRNSTDISPIHILREHQAAVRALAWCPWESRTLASGGGTADRNIKIWNTVTGTCMQSVDTGSQVCALRWNESYKELLSSHGFSDNQLILWKYPNMAKMREFRGHTSRVLHMTQSPDNATICTASADETLRFWDIFSKSSNGSSGQFPSNMIGNSAGGTGSNNPPPVLMRSSNNALALR